MTLKQAWADGRTPQLPTPSCTLMWSCKPAIVVSQATCWMQCVLMLLLNNYALCLATMMQLQITSIH